jgi:hypothetical protein
MNARTPIYLMVVLLSVVGRGSAATIMRPVLDPNTVLAQVLHLDEVAVNADNIARFVDASGMLFEIQATELAGGGSSYDLSPIGAVNLTPGDLVLLEPNSPNTSDIIRFAATSVSFFSDPEQAAEPAVRQDVISALPNPVAPILRTDEQAVAGSAIESNDGILYVPEPGDPGFDNAGAIKFGYDVLSDVSAIPEPASLVMLSLGLAAVAGLAWRRRRAA